MQYPIAFAQGNLLARQGTEFLRTQSGVEQERDDRLISLCPSGIDSGNQCSPLLLLASNEAGFTLPLFLPLSFGFAMLRSRLWDIDVLINRALVYGALTASLALIYVGLVIGLSALLRSIISHDSSVAIVISTLAIYFLFQPLRRRIQQIIDRRFYRSKYDAAKTVVALSATLRQEVDLEQLLAVAQQTMQPAHVSLWLRPTQQEGKQRAPWRATPPAP